MGINRIRLANGATGDPRIDARMQQTYQQNIADNQAQEAINQQNLNVGRERSRQRMRGMGNSGFQTQPGTLNQGIENVGNQLGVDTSGIQSGVDRVQNIIMNQAPNRFADYLSGRTEPVTDLSEIASTQSTRDIINQGILGSLERNQITNPTGSFNTVVQSKGGGGEYASNRPVDYSGYKLGNPLPGIKNYAAEVGQVLNTMGGNAENQIANTLGDYSFEYRPPSYDFDDDYMGIKDIYDFKGKSGEGGGTPYDVNVELTDADTKQKIREQLFKDATEPSAMPQGSPGQLNPTPTQEMMSFTGSSYEDNYSPEALKLMRTIPAEDYNNKGPISKKVFSQIENGKIKQQDQKPTMADVAGPAATGGGVPNYQGGTMVGPNLYLGPTGIYERIEPNGSYTSMGRTDPRTQGLASGGRVGLAEGTDPNLTARQVADQNPELHAMRQNFFGTSYLDDIDQGNTGTVQYYSGLGNPTSLNYTPPVVEEAAPVVDSGGDGGGGGAGISTGGEDGIDYSQNPLTQMITTPDGDTMTVKEAFTNDAAYTGTDQSGLGGADGMSGGQATPGAEFADQNPYGGTGTMDDLGADSFPEYQEPTVATYGDTTTGLEDPLEGFDLETGQPETIDTRADQPPSLGFGNAPEADIYQDPIMGMANMNQADVIASDANVGFDTPERTNAINEAFNSVKDLGEAGVGKLRDSLVALGGKVKEGFDNTIEIGGKTIDLTKSLIGGAVSLVSGIPGVGFLLNAVQEDPADILNRNIVDELKLENDYGYNMSSGTLNQDPFGRNPVSAFGDYEQTLLDDIDSGSNTKMGLAKTDFANDYFEKKSAATAPQEDVGAISGDYGAALDDTSSAADISQDLASQQATANVGGGNVMDEFGSGGDTQATTGATVSTSNPDYGQFGRAQNNQSSGGGDQSGGKIVCTMMNDSYGFGSFRNKIWLKHSKDLAPEYQIGYHKIFLPLIKLSKTNKVLKKTLEHIAIHRTIDIRQESRNKIHLLGRVYRKILEPICYLVGKYAK